MNMFPDEPSLAGGPLHNKRC